MRAAIEDGSLPQADLPAFTLEVPADRSHGDWACNAAMAGARAFRQAPRKIAESIASHLDLAPTYFDRCEIAGPGFLNFFLNPRFYADVLRDVEALGKDYGRSDYGKGEKVMVEFVSANPTGPMHMGNARGGALGDCLAACLDWAGYDVTREFYINDAGNQIEKFGKSLAIRYLQLYKGEDACPLPEECYQGADIVEHAKNFAAEHGDAYVDGDFEQLKKDITAFALPKNIEGLQRDLGKYRIRYDVWFHESDLHAAGAVQAVVDKLLETGACYKGEDGAILYKSAQYAAKYGVVNKKKTDSGEEEAKDEVLVRANGIPTYFAADIAYHYDKLAVRGFDKAIDVWGADHHGHVARMKGAMDAVGLDGSRLDVVLMQMVNLMRDGKPVRMSKRTGKAITLTDLLDEVPIDSARFLFNMRESSSTLDFDLDLAVRSDSENPVYYVQYAHARICSLLKKLEAQGTVFRGPEAADAALLTDASEQALIRLLAAFPAEIAAAAEKYDPARITRFVIDLATAFHRFYNACRILDAEDQVQQGRIALCLAVRGGIHNVLTMLKLNAPESM